MRTVGEMAREPELCGGPQGVLEDGRAWVRVAGGGHRGQVFTKTAGHVLIKVRGTAGAE